MSEENPYLARDFPKRLQTENNACILISFEGIYTLFVNENI